MHKSLEMYATLFNCKLFVSNYLYNLLQLLFLIWLNWFHVLLHLLIITCKCKCKYYDLLLYSWKMPSWQSALSWRRWIFGQILSRCSLRWYMLWVGNYWVHLINCEKFIRLQICILCFVWSFCNSSVLNRCFWNSFCCCLK